MKKQVNYSKKNHFPFNLMRNVNFVDLVSKIFFVDSIFNWTGMGGGLILVAQKNA